MPRVHRHAIAHAVNVPLNGVMLAAPPARSKPNGNGRVDAFVHTRAEADAPDPMGLYPSLDQMFARSLQLGTFRSTLGQGVLAAERIDDTLRLYLKTTGGFSFAGNSSFREEAARRYDPVATSGLSEAMFDDPRTSVRFIVGPKDFQGAPAKTYDVRPSNAQFAFTAIPVADLKALAADKGLSLYAEITVPDWDGGHQHAFINLDGQSFSNFQLPKGLLD